MIKTKISITKRLAAGSHKSHRAQKGLNPNLSWEDSKFEDHETIILASDISAARAYVGKFEGQFKNMGACEHIQTKNLKEIILKSNTAYLGNITCLHESLPLDQE